MPVVAAVEGGGEHARRLHVGVTVERVGDLVRVFLVDAGERQAREALGGGGVEARRRWSGWRRRSRCGERRLDEGRKSEGGHGPDQQRAQDHDPGWYIVL